MAFYMVQKLAEFITHKHMGYEIIYSLQFLDCVLLDALCNVLGL